MRTFMRVYNLVQTVRRIPARYFIHRHEQVEGWMAARGYQNVRRRYPCLASRPLPPDCRTMMARIRALPEATSRQPNRRVVRAAYCASFEVPSCSPPHVQSVPVRRRLLWSTELRGHEARS